MWWYSVVVSISGCDPLDPGSNPGTAIPTVFCCFLFSVVFCFLLWCPCAVVGLFVVGLFVVGLFLLLSLVSLSLLQHKKKPIAFGGTRTHATKGDYDLNVAP